MAQDYQSGDLLCGDRYQIKEILGKGGMGVVYKAYDKITELDVAIKTIHPEVSMCKDEMSEIKQNYQMIQNLKHPNIAALNQLEFDQKNNEYIIVMEYVLGVNLHDYIRSQENRVVRPSDAIRIIGPLAAGLDEAHRQRIIHRDIKPKNIIRTPNGEIKILDFGLAMQIKSTMSRRNIKTNQNISGTWPYMAPEQWCGDPQKEPADVYGLGVVFYEMVSGHPPFDNPDLNIMMEIVRTKKPKKLKVLNAQQNKAMHKALAKEEEGRFKSAGQFYAALQPKPKGMGFMAVMGIILLCLALLIGSSYWFWQEQQFGFDQAVNQLANGLVKEMDPELHSMIAICMFEGEHGTRPMADAVYDRLSAHPDIKATFEIKNWKKIEQVLKVTKAVSPVQLKKLLKVHKDMHIDAIMGGRIFNEGNSVRISSELTRVYYNVQKLKYAVNIPKWKIRDNFLTGLTASEPEPIIAKPKPAKPEEPVYGSIKITSEPTGAEVVLGRHKGRTPLTLENLTPGSHDIIITKPEFKTLRLPVKIKANETAKIHQNLPALSGSLYVTSSPGGAIVKINGDEKGHTPKSLKGLDRGKLQLEIHKKCYAKYTKTTDIRGGQESKVHVDLEKICGKLTLQSQPREAKWYLGKKDMGRTGNEIELEQGQYTIKVTKKGYRKWTKSVKVKADDSQNITAKLILEEPGEPTHGTIFKGPWGMKFVYIKAGTFTMGSPKDEPGRYDNEIQYQVKLSKGFYLQTKEMTNWQFVQFLNKINKRGSKDKPWFETESQDSDSHIKGSVGKFYVETGFKKHPMVEVSWYGADAMAQWLTNNHTGTYRLPTEAEWEYAARAGTTGPFAFGNCLSTAQANYDGDYPLQGCNKGTDRGGTIEVGILGKNNWGLYDMHGNVYEWCWDWYQQNASIDQKSTGTNASTFLNPTGARSGTSRVLRGGSWSHNAGRCRSANRYRDGPGYSGNAYGFRLALSPRSVQAGF